MLRASSKTLAIAIIIIVIIAAAAAFVMLSKPTGQQTTTPAAQRTSPRPAGEQTTPVKSEKPSLTGDLEKDIVSIGKYLVSQGIHEVKFTAYSKGDPNSVMRVYGIVEAAYRLNKILEKHGIDLKIVVKPVFERGGSPKSDDILMAYQQGTNPDIYALSYVEIAPLADSGVLLDITDWVKLYKDTWEDFYPALREAVSYKGRVYALPQDTEARPLYWRIDIAECIKEKAGKDILAGLREKIEKGEITWHEIYEFAKLAKETGCAEWGLIHRKGSAHPDLIQFIYAYGGKLEDPETGKLILDVPAVYKWLYTEWKFAQDGLLPKDMMHWDWAKQIHPTVVNGKTLIFIGGTWHWTEWQTKPYYTDPKTGENRPLTAEEVKKHFYYTLFAAGDHGNKPVTLSQPFVWIVMENAGHQNPKYDELKDVYRMLAFLLILKACDPDINAIHSIISAHLPVRKEAEKLLRDNEWIEKLKNLELDLAPEVKDAIADIVAKTVNPINIEFLADAAKMLEWTHLTPKHPYYGKLAAIFADAVDKVLRGELTPDKAVEYIIQKVKADPDLAKSVEIRGEIPKDWKFP